MENTKMLTDEELAKELAKMTPGGTRPDYGLCDGPGGRQAQAKAAEPAGGAA